MSRRHRVAGILVLLVGGVLVASCAKLSTSAAVPGGIPAESLEAKDSIPQAWGHLVSVSSVAEYPDLVQLWLEDEQGTIRYAVVSLRTHEIRNAHVIRRK